MVSSACKTLCIVLVIISTAVCIHAQTITQKVASGSVSGKVTIKGKRINRGVHPITGLDPERGTYRSRALFSDPGQQLVVAGNHEPIARTDRFRRDFIWIHN